MEYIGNSGKMQKEMVRRLVEMGREGAERTSEMNESLMEKMRMMFQDACHSGWNMKQGMRQGAKRRLEESRHGAGERVSVVRKWMVDYEKGLLFG